VNQYVTVDEAVFPVGATPRLYNKDLRELRDRIERVSGVGSWQNN
jgi:hypothetical protein